MTAPARQSGKRHWGQALFAATLAAWTLYIAFSLLYVLYQQHFQQDSRQDQVGYVLAMGILGFPFALIVCASVGVPALALVYWWQLTQLWQVALVGAAGGVLVMLGLRFVFNPINGLSFNADVFWVCDIFCAYRRRRWRGGVGELVAGQSGFRKAPRNRHRMTAPRANANAQLAAYNARDLADFVALFESAGSDRVRRVRLKAEA